MSLPPIDQWNIVTQVLRLCVTQNLDNWLILYFFLKQNDEHMMTEKLWSASFIWPNPKSENESKNMMC